MSFSRNYRTQGGTLHIDGPTTYYGNSNYMNGNWDWKSYHCRGAKSYNSYNALPGIYSDQVKRSDYPQSHCPPAPKRRKFSSSSWGESERQFLPPNPNLVPDSLNTNQVADSLKWTEISPATRFIAEVSTSTRCKRDRSKLEDDEPLFMSRVEIERHSPSRKDGIDVQRETHLRYSYCAFLQNLGLRLDVPQTTIGTSMVLCHRFFIRRSHACHNRFVIASAALFLAAKSEETARPLNNVVRASCEILHKQDISYLSYLLPVDWFEQYREQMIDAETMILTTLNFELGVQHPYMPLTSVLSKLGLSQDYLLNLALSLVSEGWLRTSLWLQFKPHQIAAGAAYLAAKLLNFDLGSYHNIWQEFHASPAVIQDVSEQLMELF